MKVTSIGDQGMRLGVQWIDHGGAAGRKQSQNGVTVGKWLRNIGLEDSQELGESESAHFFRPLVKSRMYQILQIRESEQSYSG